MSYYQFSGPVQGGYGPWEDEMRRRKKHHHVAAPYGRQKQPVSRQSKYEQVPDYDVQMDPPDQQPAGQGPPGPGPPRHAAAVDMGQGPVQMQQAGQPAQMDIGEQKRLAHQFFGGGGSEAPQPAVGSGGLSRKAGIGESPSDDLGDFGGLGGLGGRPTTRTPSWAGARAR